MEATTITWGGGGERFPVAGRWSRALARAGIARSQAAPRLCRKQPAPDLVEIGQGKHGLRPRQVLGQAAVSDLGETPQLLDYPKRMLATGAGPRAGAIDHSPPLAPRLARGAPIDPVAHPARAEGLAIGFLPVGLIAKYLALLSVQQAGKLGEVGRRSMGRGYAVDDAPLSGSNVQLHAEVPGVALAGLLHLGVARRRGVLGRTRRRDEGGVDDGSLAQP